MFSTESFSPESFSDFSVFFLHFNPAFPEREHELERLLAKLAFSVLIFAGFDPLPVNR